ncbi:MAG: hypothetical protein GX414_06320 [Acidobacteria bacterium]|nr:hypothetical protein [Acidobacteriota bacterium]
MDHTASGHGVSRRGNGQSIGKRALRALQNHQWLIIGALALASIGLGIVGFRNYSAATGQSRSFWDILYLALQLFTLESGSVYGPAVGWELEVARLLAPGIAAIAAVKAFALVFREQLQLFRMRFVRGHVVICGLGRKGLRLARQLRAEGRRVVAIERDEGNDHIAQCRDLGVVVLPGDATDVEMLRKARLGEAACVVAVCGDDGANAEVAVHARELARWRRGQPLQAVVHITDPQLCRLLVEQELERRHRDPYRLEFFNVFDIGARSWLSLHPATAGPEGRPLPAPHLTLVGLGRMGESLLVQAARGWRDAGADGEFHVTVIDRFAAAKVASLCHRYPRLAQACRLTALDMDVESPEFHRGDYLPARDGATAVFICLDNDALGLAAALALQPRTRSLNIPVVVRMTGDAGLATLLRGDEAVPGAPPAIQAFSLLDQACRPEQILAGTHEALARTIHADYCRHQRERGETPATNPAMVPWDELPEHLRDSNRDQAAHIGVKLRELGCALAPLTDWDEPLFAFTADEVERLARLEHDRWVDERRRAGWRPGPAKDVDRKISAYLVPWEALTEPVRDQDREPVRQLPRFLAGAGFKIIRLNRPSAD